MKRLVSACAVSFALSATAAAMPSDLPWQIYACKDGKNVNFKFLSDGMAIGVLFGKDETKEDMITAAPVDEEKQAGFKPGIYKSVDPGDFTLTLAEDGTIGIQGKDVPKGPYEGCKDTGKSFGGDTPTP